MAASRAGIVSTSTVAGCSPSSPSRTALSLPCPLPVRPSDPYRQTRTVWTCGMRPSSRRPSANWRAARIGPTVCELDGPIPTLNRSNTLIVMASSLTADGTGAGTGGERELAPPDPAAGRVIRRPQAGRGGHELAGDADLVVARYDRIYGDRATA